jgi:hypothetical protein
LQQHPRVQFHFTPTYSSWLNQVEIWFAKIEREALPAASSPQFPTWLANSAATSTPTPPTLAPSSGNILNPTRHLRANEFTATVHWWPIPRQLLNNLSISCTGRLKLRYERRLWHHQCNTSPVFLQPTIRMQ